MSTAAPTAMAPGNKAPAPAKQDNATALAKWETPTNTSGLEALSPMVTKKLMMALPSFMNDAQTADRLLRCLITECQATPRLLECTPISLFGCAIKAAQLGLEIGGPLGRSYLLPFKNNKKGVQEAQLIVGYKGFIELAHRSGQIKRITPVCVRKGDHYKVTRGLHQNLEHLPLRSNTGPVTDYYVVIELITGGLDFEEFTVEQAIDFRDRYSTVKNAPDYVKKNSPWYDIQEGSPPLTGLGFDAMALKTLIRRMAKRTPMSAEMNNANSLEDAVERGTPQHIPIGLTAGMPDLLGSGELIPGNAEPVDEAAALKQRLEDAKNAKTEEPDRLPELIVKFDDLGGDLMAFLETHGTKEEGAADFKAIQASTGDEREKWAGKFDAAIKKIEEAKAKKK